MDHKEHYLYGTLMALAQDQKDAINKLTSGTLGFFGKSRIQSRGREIGKFITKISKHKNTLGIQNTHESVLTDLSSIKNKDFPFDKKEYSNETFDTLKIYLNEILA
jgi:hypothetical protein